MFRQPSRRLLHRRRDLQPSPSEARLPRPAARLLAVMFADRGCLLPEPAGPYGEGFGKSLPRVLRALVEAGFMSKQAGTSRVPDSYRLLLPLEAQP